MKPNPAADSSMEQILADIRDCITADIAAQGADRPGGRRVPAATEAAELPANRDARPVAQPGQSGLAPTAVGPERVVALHPRPAESEVPERPQRPPQQAAVARQPIAKPAQNQPYGFTVRREDGGGTTQAVGPRDTAGQTERRAPPDQPVGRPANAADEARRPAPTAPMLSPEADARISRSFNRLADTLLSNDSHTLEELVRETLRPMLKSWLDTNLPPLVERLVREEIERVARGQRGG